jgi:hypothetical protein
MPAGSFAALLLVFAALVGWVTIQGTVQDYPETNPGAVITVGLIAVGLVLYAVWRLAAVATGDRRRAGAVLSYGLAVFALIGWYVVAVLTDRSIWG